jgi:hypothetical protein
MGFAVSGGGGNAARKTTSRTMVETEIENSEVVADALQRGVTMTLQKDGVQIDIGQDERGGCKVCVTGEGRSRAQLKEIGEQVSGRIVQQFAYHKLMTELKQRNYKIVSEQVMQDEAIQVRVRL